MQTSRLRLFNEFKKQNYLHFYFKDIRFKVTIAYKVYYYIIILYTFVDTQEIYYNAISGDGGRKK